MPDHQDAARSEGHQETVVSQFFDVAERCHSPFDGEPGDMFSLVEKQRVRLRDDPAEFLPGKFVKRTIDLVSSTHLDDLQFDIQCDQQAR
jgi:hypothetical protein